MTLRLPRYRSRTYARRVGVSVHVNAAVSDPLGGGPEAAVAVPSLVAPP
ncbi:hypothetical protein FHS35_002524 [Streptomyces umbrinus]|nr:hypothetical protein [Streptomyces umbrinus]MCR3725676.1 hypothetical protein [Streptomyces umbrinus]MCX4560373.1 hypothetical protein [Streptomyces phaeochromogenes]